MNHSRTTIAGIVTIVIGTVMFAVLYAITKDAEKLPMLVAMLTTTLTAGTGLIVAADGKNVPPNAPPPDAPK